MKDFATRQKELLAQYSASVVSMAGYLYVQFWTRNGLETIPAFKDQAIAIQSMWLNIADDAMEWRLD